MKRVKYLKSIDNYLSEDVFFKLISDNGYSAPIRYKYRSNTDISKVICSFNVFSEVDIKEIEKQCSEDKLIRPIEKTDKVNMILLWGTNYFFANSIEDNPYLYATPTDIQYSITDMNGRLVAGEFSSAILDKRFKHLYQPLLLELKVLLINSGWFTDLREENSRKISRDFFNRIDTKNIYIRDVSDADSIGIEAVRCSNNTVLFTVKQEDDIVDEDLLFSISIIGNNDNFTYKCMIITEEDFKHALKNVIESIDDNDEFKSYKCNLEEIYNML